MAIRLVLDLSDDVLQSIIAALCVEDAFRLRLVCTRFRDQFRDEYLWKYFAMANGICQTEESADWKALLMDFWQVLWLYFIVSSYVR